MTTPNDTMTLRINGSAHTVPAALTVEGLLRHLEIDARQVGVERNGELVPKARFAATELAADDELEVVTFVGGG